MINQYTKGVRTQLTKNFSSLEFDCKCTRPECTITLIDENLPQSCEAVREQVGGPVFIDSGYRCPAHNADPAVGGAANSQHPKGHAADLRAIGYTGTEMAAYAENVPAFASGGIGTYPTFAHCDVRPNGPARWSHPSQD